MNPRAVVALAFLAGAGLGFGIGRGPDPAPRPTPSPSPILAVVDEDKVDRLTCETMMAGAVIAERLRLTGKPNP